MSSSLSLSLTDDTLPSYYNEVLDSLADFDPIKGLETRFGALNNTPFMKNILFTVAKYLIDVKHKPDTALRVIALCTDSAFKQVILNLATTS